MRMNRRLSVVSVLVVLAGCGTTSRAPAEHAPPPDSTAVEIDPPGAPMPPTAVPGCPADPASATADQNLLAMVSQGEALPDHVGPDAARAIFADLDREPARYLDRFECRFVSQSPGPGYDSLLLAVPLWRLRKHDRDRVELLASRVVYRYEELSRTPPDPSLDPSFAQRVAQRVATMSFIRDGLDVATGPRWVKVPTAGFTACTTASPDGTAAIHVTRACTCGETLSCRATTAASGALELAVHYDPDSPARCTDCYPTSTSCTLPSPSPRTLPPVC